MHLASTPIVLRMLAMLAVLASCGCTPAIAKRRSPLAPAQMSPDSVVLEVFSVRVPQGDEQANEELWREVDEQHVPAEVRKRLAQNGFRVGVVGNPMPPTLSKLLELKDKPAPNGNACEVKLDEMAAEPRVERRHMPLRSGARGEIVASELYPQLPVLLCRPGDLSGQVYTQAQGVLGVRACARGDGRVRLELTPELQHDQPRQRWVAEQGLFRLDSCRPKRVFDDMTIASTLAPGEMLLVTSLPGRSGSLGHHFFSTGKEHAEQKLFVVRLTQTQHHEFFSPPEVLKLEE